MSDSNLQYQNYVGFIQNAVLLDPINLSGPEAVYAKQGLSKFISLELITCKKVIVFRSRTLYKNIEANQIRKNKSDIRQFLFRTSLFVFIILSVCFL